MKVFTQCCTCDKVAIKRCIMCKGRFCAGCASNHLTLFDEAKFEEIKQDENT